MSESAQKPPREAETSRPQVVDLAWISSCNHRDAEEAERILAEILVHFDRGTRPIVVSGRSSTEGGFMPDYDQHNALVRWRAEVVRMLVHRRVLQSAESIERHRHERYVIEADEAVIRYAHGLFMARCHGGVPPEMLLSATMTVGRRPLTWLEETPTDLLEESRDILDAVLREIALAKARIRISAYPDAFQHRPLPIGNEAQIKAMRSEVAEMLVRRQILISQQSLYVGGGPYGADEDRGDWLEVQADPETVRHASAQIRDQLAARERYRRLPARDKEEMPEPRWARLAPAFVNYGHMSVSNITSIGDQNTINVTIGDADVAGLKSLVDDLRKALKKLGLEHEQLETLKADVAAVEAQLKSPKPRAAVIKGLLAGAGKILAGAAAKALADPLVRRIEEALRSLPA